MKRNPNLKPSVPCYKLTSIAAPLMNHLKSLLQVIQDQESEISFLRTQIQQLKEKTASQETLVEDRSIGNSVGQRSPALVVLKSMPPPPNTPPPPD